MKNKLRFATLGLLLVMGIGALGLTLFQVGGLLPARTLGATLAQPNQAAPAQAAPNQNNAASLVGEYSGVVKLQMTVAGQFSDTLPTQPISGTPDLGSIDLALSLSQTGSVVNGYVSLDKTLVFSAEHTIQKDGKAFKIGPTLNGSFDGATLTLLSERVATTLGARSIQRQFWISGTLTQSDGSQFTGQYRETIWGVAYRPVTVIGSFTLQRPAHGKNVPESGNKAPETVADTATTAQGAAVTINVLTNDSDANGDALTITSVSKPQFGTATINGQSVIYTPNANFVGTDTIAYFVSDGKGGTAAGSVTVTVTVAGGSTPTPSASSAVYLPVVNK